MIVRPHPHPLSLLFILRGSIIHAIIGELVVVLGAAALITGFYHFRPMLFSGISLAPFTLLGLALSIFLGFRNNACYQRWWEARQQWGRLIAETRSFMRDLRAVLPDRDDRTRRLGRRIVGFAHALRCQLRGERVEAAQPWLPAGEWLGLAGLRGKPSEILNLQAQELADALRAGEITDILYRVFSERLATMGNIQAACERLQSTPTPFAYTLLLHRTAWLFCLLTPIGIVSTLGWLTPLATVVLAYAFFGLDALGQELQEPFERTANAVPLDALVRIIEISVLEALGETEIPEPLLPQDFVLL
ncbi:bestrophin [Acidisoma cellulosilytica]|uniref:Bestrophin n=1 Tax=Acidisoma cellulosilyticum TaxID=2802395 RepID=A0A963Z0S1_9PROT|nr:bestrophin family ion channel [Acidisoma cellulosilyticum]MCB8880536.1 bestrophin [Acidisoma cellulosilyticum]